MKSVLVDIDHTISDAFWRDPMMGVSSWDEYHLAAEHDKPLHDVVSLVRCLKSCYNLIGFTARPEKFRARTNLWCVKYQVPLDEMLMRPDESYKPAPEIKRTLIEKRFGDRIHEEIAFVLEDREDVCAMFRGLGITVLQVHGKRG